MCVKKKEKGSSLAWKFGLLTGTEVAVAIIAVLIFYMAQEWRSARKHLVETGTSVAVLMARDLGERESLDCSGGLLPCMDGLDTLPAISYVLILDADGKVLARRSKVPAEEVPELPAGPSTPLYAGETSVSGGFHEIPVPGGRGSFIDVVVPIGDASKPNGFVRIGLARDHYALYHPRVTWPQLTFCAFILVCMIALTCIVSRKITYPVKALQRVAKEISAGNLDSSVEIKSNDEISDYSRAFNTILSRFEEYRAQAEENSETAQAAKARLEHFLLSSPGVIFSCKPDRPWEASFVSDGIRSLLGYDPGQIMDDPSSWLDLAHPADRADLLDRMERLPSLCSDISEFRLRHASGEYVWIRDEMRVHFDEDGTPKEFIGCWVDITSYKAMEEKLIFDAFHDGITKLPNRALFLDRLNVSFARSKRHQACLFALLFLDVDNFKSINDTMGHEAGDLVLQTIATRLLNCVRFGDTVARWGGDEFAIIVQDIKNAEEAREISARLLTAFDQPFLIQEQKKFVTGSIGATLAGSSYRHPEHLLRDADIAMYQAKKDGRARAVLFRESMRESALARRKLDSDLRLALKNNEFAVHYQPIMDAVSERPVGTEALLRWNHPANGMVMPADFIPLAEESGIIIPVGGWVLREACVRLKDWNARKVTNGPFRMSVNISGRQLTGDFPDEVRRVIDDLELDPSSLILEITESSVLEDFDRAASAIRQLRKMDISVFMDDFGTGYSSMRYLHRLPVNGLKIDRSFVAALSPDNEILEIVRSMVQLAGKLNLAVVAEGVEKKSQLDCLREIGCSMVQGYFFERPMDEARTVEFLRKGGPSSGRVPG